MRSDVSEVRRSLTSGGNYAAIEAVLGTDKVLVLDTEFDAGRQRIFEIALMDLKAAWSTSRSGGRAKHHHFHLPHTWLIDPQTAISSYSRNAAGVDDSDLVGAGTFAEHAPRLARILDGRRYLVGWNIGNDRNILEAEWRRCGLSYGEMQWIDLARMFRSLHELPRICKLTEACDYYGITLHESEAHFAFYDTIATARLLAAVCDEWITKGQERDDLNLAISGFASMGGWDPRVLSAPVEPIRWRVGDCPKMNMHVWDADATFRTSRLKYALVSCNDEVMRQDIIWQLEQEKERSRTGAWTPPPRPLRAR